MAVLRQGDAVRVADRAIVLDLGDLKRQGEAMRAHTQSQIGAMLAEAKAERERLITGASNEGRAQGLREGKELGLRQGADEGRKAALQEHRAALDAIEAAWKDALDRFIRERERLLSDARQDVVRLATLIASRVTKRCIELDPSVIEAQLAAVLAQLSRPTRLMMSIHPEDEPIARAALPGLLAALGNTEHVDLRTDDSVARGSCVATTPGGGVIDAGIEPQLDRMVEALLPRERA